METTLVLQVALEIDQHDTRDTDLGNVKLISVDSPNDYENVRYITFETRNAVIDEGDRRNSLEREISFMASFTFAVQLKAEDITWGGRALTYGDIDTYEIIDFSTTGEYESDDQVFAIVERFIEDRISDAMPFLSITID